MRYKRRKGVAIVETDKGILVVAGRSKRFMLPGGGAERWESRKKAAIRELYEETGLRTKNIKYLFKYVGGKWHTHSGRAVKNHSKVFLVESEGNPRPRSEIKYLDFWKKGKNLRITLGAKVVIEKYLKVIKFNFPTIKNYYLLSSGKSQRVSGFGN